MKTRYFMVAFIALGLLAISTAPGLAQETTIKNMDEYRAQLADWQKREVDAKAAITEETAKIADLKKKTMWDFKNNRSYLMDDYFQEEE